MKKLYYLLVAALCCSTLSAQTLNEGFEGESFPPEGWTTIDGYAGYGWKKGTKLQQTCAKIQEVTGTESWLITPQLKPAAGESLSFQACVGDYASSGELRIEVSLSGTEATSFEVLDTYYTSKSRGDAAHQLWKTEWRTYSIDLSQYVGSSIYIGFHQAGSTDVIFLDNVSGVSLRGTSTCENPSGIVLSNLDAHEATFTWQGDADQYQYILIEKGEEVDWTAATLISAKTVSLTGLYEETDYEFYVRSYCSAEAQSLAPKTAFKTPCENFNIPWLETFTRDQTGSGFDVSAPDCWTVTTGMISVVKDKTYDDEGGASTVNGQAHLQAVGGGPTSPQVFAMPTFNATLNTLEVAFDYKTSLTTEACGQLEVGFMTNPNKASTFVSLQTLARSLEYTHAVVSLEDLPSTAKFIAFRFAGGTSEYGALSMDNFVVAPIGESGNVDPSQEEIPDAGIYAQTYCEASFTWYSYNNSAFAIGLADSTGTLIAGILATTEECDRFAYQDGVGFSEDEDYENKYYCSTKWILNADEEGQQRGAGWDAKVTNIGTSVSPVLGLVPGSYQVQVLALIQDTSGHYSTGETLATIPFTLEEKKVESLAVSVSEDKTTATLTWIAPEFGQGERLYVRVWSGDEVAYDNLNTKERPTSPLVVTVEEGKSYTAIVVVVDKNNNPMGSEQEITFTVGTNPYEPISPTATVEGGDNVTFTWGAATKAERYVITLFWNGEFYATLTVSDTTKMTTMPKDGTWSWTVQAFNQGANGKYFEASNAIEGNTFTSKAADIPADAIVMDVWQIEAAYMDANSGYDAAGKNAWYISLATGEEGGQGLPSPIFMIYTDKQNAISGNYNIYRQNIDLSNCGIDMTGRQADALDADTVELRLTFDGYDDDKASQGPYRYGYYSGQFRIVAGGKTYVGKFMEVFCNSFSFSSYSAAYRDHVGMWDEDPDYIAPEQQGIESISVTTEKAEKVLLNGMIYIVRPDGAIYNATGLRLR